MNISLRVCLFASCVAAASAFGLASQGVDAAAGPRLLLVTGGPLAHTVIMSDWVDNMALMHSLTQPVDVRPADLSAGRYLDVAMFWGPEWAEYVDSGRPLSLLTPEQGNQHGRLYPATRRSPALFAYTERPDPEGFAVRRDGLVRLVNAKGVELFAKYGIDLRSPRSE